MTLFFHELRQNKISLIIWTAILSFVMATTVLIYPEMASQMDELTEALSQMGSFSEAFGISEMNFNEFINFFGSECSSSLGLGAAFFAALLGISALAKEEKEHTAEFLLTHPVSRGSVVTQKLLAVVAELVLLNAAVLCVCTLSAVVIKETDELAMLALLVLAQLLMQISIAAVCFGISAFIRRGGVGIGLGVAAVFYFLSLLSNIDEALKLMKYLTPFSLAESGYILENRHLSPTYLAIAAAISAAAIVLAYTKYTKKDIY